MTPRETLFLVSSLLWASFFVALGIRLGTRLIRGSYRSLDASDREFRGVAEFVAGSVAILGGIGVAALPFATQVLTCTKGPAVHKQAMTNIMNIAGEIERFHADGNFTYTNGNAQRGCPGSARYVGNGTAVGILPIAVQGEYYRYRIESWDADGDASCECYRVTAEPVLPPATRKPSLSYDCNGVKVGPWR